MGAGEGQQTVTMNETKGSWLGRNNGRKTERKGSFGLCMILKF